MDPEGPACQRATRPSAVGAARPLPERLPVGPGRAGVGHERLRFVEQLREDGYLHESAPSLEWVRRDRLFNRWQWASDREPREIPMRFRLPGNSEGQLRKIVSSGRACLALFAAADVLRLEFVKGVPPHVYVERVQPANIAAWKSLRPCEPGESPDVVLRQRQHLSLSFAAW